MSKESFNAKFARREKRERRTSLGSASAELPLCLSISLLMFAFPFTDLLFISARYALAFASCSAAARAAAAAPAFITNQQSSLSAVNISKEKLSEWSSKFSGIALQRYTTVVRGCPIPAGKSPTEYASVLSPQAVADSDYVYVYEVRALFSIEPLLKLDGFLFGPIQGLNEPLQITCVCQRVCEKPETLIK